VSEHDQEGPQLQDTSREWDEARGDDAEGMREESPPESEPKETRAE
jgi:hypothetical protein